MEDTGLAWSKAEDVPDEVVRIVLKALDLQESVRFGGRVAIAAAEALPRLGAAGQDVFREQLARRAVEGGAQPLLLGLARHGELAPHFVDLLRRVARSGGRLDADLAKSILERWGG